jgi:F-box protein 11
VHDELRCDAKIKNNEISGNKENGINCNGNNNFTRIENNTFIGYNKRAGIKADNNASIIVYKNMIGKNLG